MPWLRCMPGCGVGEEAGEVVQAGDKDDLSGPRERHTAPGSAQKIRVPRLENRDEPPIETLRVWSAQDAGGRRCALPAQSPRVHLALTTSHALALPVSSSVIPQR